MRRNSVETQKTKTAEIVPNYVSEADTE